MVELAGKTALVTGAAHRVGKAIATTLAAHGVRIALHYHGSESDANNTVRELQASGCDVVPFRADLSQPKVPEQLIADVIAHFGVLDILVNSAAMMVRTPVGAVSVEQWEAMFALNVRAPFFLAQAAQPALEQSKGCIVNIADLAAFETWPAYVPHTMTKAAIVQMTRGLAHALAPDVRVNGIAPGAVLLPSNWDQQSAQHLIDTTPLKRIGSPEDVAQAVVYLVQADYVTGDVLFVDGGRHVRT